MHRSIGLRSGLWPSAGKSSQRDSRAPRDRGPLPSAPPTDLRKGSAFPNGPNLKKPGSAQAGRLGLPACAEHEGQYGTDRKARGFPQVGAAEPQLALVLVRNLGASSLVGLGRVELPTSPLSGVRSSQLSYRPAARSGLRKQPADPGRRFYKYRWRNGFTQVESTICVFIAF